MADFTGMTVEVKLRQPPNTVVQGKVREVVAGQTLTLENVLFPSTGTELVSWTVQASAIAGLQVIEASKPPAITPTASIRTNDGPSPPHIPSAPPLSISTTARFPPAVNATPIRQSANFVDPAILSYGKSPVHARSQAPRPPSTTELPATPIKSLLAKATESLPVTSSPFVAEPTGANNARKTSKTKTRDVTPVAPQMNAPRIIPEANRNSSEKAIQDVDDVASKKKVRRGQKKKPVADTLSAQSEPPLVMNIEVSRNGNDMSGSVKRDKGWRSTPLLQPSPSAENVQGRRKQTRRQRETDKETQQNGWATEDATDVQDMGDFDFEASNKLFDKKGVFDQLRQGDTTADEDRLVSHNKVHRPGTYGGKNLHPTENVLSPKLGPKHHSNDGDSTSDADTELNFVNGRSTSRHSTTRAKKLPSRQNSAQVDGRPHILAASLSSERGLTRSVTSLPLRNGKPSSSMNASSPRPDRSHSPFSAASASKARKTRKTTSRGPCFLLPATNTVCPTLHPAALDTLEAETVSRFGLTKDAVTESAGRCIAELAMSMFEDAGGSRRPSRANTLRRSVTSSSILQGPALPVVVILAGNHSMGAQAIAAARQLVGRSIKIIVAEALYESAETQDPQMRTQTAMLRRIMRQGLNIKRGPWRKASTYIKNLAGPPAVIIDALLAGSPFNSLLVSNAQHAADAQLEAREMIDWANRSRATVLSVGCPSGVSGIDGSATIVEGEPLAVRPDKVLALAAPMTGLLEATKNGERFDLSVADIGINITLRTEEAVDFGAHWVTELKYVDEDGLAESGQ